ncbi:serine hydrolase [Streptomyces sp. NPDC047017]|uniref:serine hydrolase n=1 Tax=Streptomyces sp. NPDC047017 TaxID=3155024 RepID=UPI0033D7D176
MPNRSRPLPRPRTGALLASAALLLSAGTLGAAAPAHAAGASRVTAAVLPLDGGAARPTVYGDDVPYDTASIIKVDILATVLLRAQDAGRPLTAQERAWAEPMIRHSDNASANALWREIGEAPGLAAANERLGLTATQGGPGARWGLTRTTASDQIRLLSAVFGTDGATPLDAASRSYIRTLMNSVAPEQAWGVSAAGTETVAALKNGWLRRDASGLWDVNSVGRITVDGHRYLVAVLSDGNSSMDEGVSLVQRTARAAVASATAGR